MNLLKEILKGILIGIANIIPGVSGGTMAVSLGVYDKMIKAITGLRKDFKTSIITLIPYVLGAVAGIGALSFVVKSTLQNYPLQTSGLFIGLIIGGIPILVGKVKSKKITMIHMLCFIVFFLIVTGMAFLNGNGEAATDIPVTAVNMIILFIIGMVASATMIIPGISGSLVLMILGYYSIIISNISTFLEALVSFETSALLHGVGIFVPFGLGILFGIGIVAKAIEILFEKAPVITYCSILGLIIGSPIAIIYKAGIGSFGIPEVAVTVLTFITGFCISYFLGKE